MSTPQQIATACRNFGTGIVGLPPEVSGPQLLWALAGVESSHGRDALPRHEPAYDVGGRYADSGNMPALAARFGRHAAACSYGVWQVMMTNAPVGYTPADLEDLTGGAVAARSYLNSKLRQYAPKNLIEIGECYNAGRIVSDVDYTDKLVRCYAVPILNG